MAVTMSIKQACFNKSVGEINGIWNVSSNPGYMRNIFSENRLLRTSEDPQFSRKLILHFHNIKNSENNFKVAVNLPQSTIIISHRTITTQLDRHGKKVFNLSSSATFWKKRIRRKLTLGIGRNKRLWGS